MFKVHVSKFNLIYQQLRAQTRASEQWAEVHQVPDLMVKLLDVNSKDNSSETWYSCTEVDPTIAEKVKLAAKRQRQKAKEAVRKLYKQLRRKSTCMPLLEDTLVCNKEQSSEHGK